MLWLSMNGVHTACSFLQVNDTLSKPSGKVCVMIFSRSSVGRQVRAMEAVVEVVVEVVVGEGALARLAGKTQPWWGSIRLMR